MQNLSIAFLATAFLTLGSAADAQSLKGSRASMERQHSEAVKYGYAFAQTAALVSKFVTAGDLVKVEPSKHFELHDVSYPYARPPVKLFIERLSAQYFVACGEKLTITSLTRPIDKQPNNASSESVHPTGMAVDLRIPAAGRCRTWLENTLLSLEIADVLDVTRERRPPHYHVAVFTESYRQYAMGASSSTTISEYEVRRGDTLSRIASITGASIAQLRAANGIRGDLINVGQKLAIPGSSVSGPAVAPEVMASNVSSSASGNSNDVASVTETTHRVKRGDTLWRIARRYGISVDELSAENRLVNDALQIGQVLRITTSLTTL